MVEYYMDINSSIDMNETMMAELEWYIRLYEQRSINYDKSNIVCGNAFPV